ncbi:ferrochelatase [Candidatus Pelagadaptatus aseana]|uniref:ferrochelatase n=1 Tax=Candidatus Pelagadaptatus aseana TaxID=3120508 RepID=UPI003C6EB0E9
MSDRLGVVLVNLGTPEKPTAAAVRKFLAEFLSDQRVVEIPKPIWQIILNCFILPFRPGKVAEAYQSIWTEDGSPLLAITKRQVAALKENLAEDVASGDILIRYAMTYGSPSIEDVVTEMESYSGDEYIDRILILPLYPQFSATTTGAVYDQVARLTMSRRDIPNLVVHKQYYQLDSYIEALAGSIARYREQHGSAEKLLFSFHGIPRRCVDLGDPYYCQCKETAERTVAKLGLEADDWEISFQSRLGKAEWLKPYTSNLLESWGESGVNSVQVVCPAFAADCLETLEEIKIENRDVFLEAGGKNYSMIPCLNDDPDHIQMLANIVKSYKNVL